MTKRVIVTGSRHWTDAQRIWTTLDQVHAWASAHGMTLVHGDCIHGADRFAEDWQTHNWRKVSGMRYKALWDRYGRRAGPIRNAQMVGDGADLCLAFLTPESKGGAHCADLAERNGILTMRFW